MYESIEQTKAPTTRWYDIVAYSLPFVLVAGLSMTYAISPSFYLKYVLYTWQRETQFVEIVTFGSALLGGLLLLVVAARLWRGMNGRQFRLGTLGIAVVGAASLFFAMEEISWGQHIFGWETPESMREFSHETNAHNSEIPIQSLGSLFIVFVFVVLPIGWSLKNHMNLPGSLRPMIAEAPVVVCTSFAFVWKGFKEIYRVVVPDYEDVEFYINFVEQINEHKEMLFAIAMLIYGLYRLPWMWRKAGAAPGAT